MIRIEPFRIEHAYIMDCKDRPGKSQLLGSTALYALELDQLKKDGPTGTAFYKGRIQLCAGLRIYWKGVAEAWAMVNDEAEPLIVEEVIVKQLDIWRKTLKLHRVQAKVRADFPAGIRFMDHLLFTREAVMEKFGPEKETYYQYVRFYDEV